LLSFSKTFSSRSHLRERLDGLLLGVGDACGSSIDFMSLVKIPSAMMALERH